MMMVVDTVLRFIYPPQSILILAISVMSIVSMVNAGFMEIKGKHVQYSKFWNVGGGGGGQNKSKVSGKTGMIISYTPAFLVCAASFFLVSDEGFRFVLLRSALTVHFFKRLVEVLFVHKYSGYMDVEAAITIAISYFLYTITMIYSQHLSKGHPDPPIDLKYTGIALFLLGISGNFYHHFLLSRLRTNSSEKQYKIPRGGLFDWVICPHYLFEIIGFLGISCISQTLYSFAFAFGSAFYLMGRSYATKTWYHSKFDDFPNSIKALIPFVF